MTCLLAFTDSTRDRAVVCVDSGCWRGELVSVDRIPKVWRCGPLVVGYCGMIWGQQLARGVPWCEEFFGSTTTETIENYIVEVHLRAASRIETIKKLDGSDQNLGAFVIAFGSEVFHVGGDGGIGCPAHGVASAGVGSDLALGAFVAMRGSGLETDAAASAMRIASRYTHGCIPPFRWMATDGQEGIWE